MAEAAVVPDVKPILISDSTDRDSLMNLRVQVCTDRPLKAAVDDLLRELNDEDSELLKSLPAGKAATKRGLALWVLGKTEQAAEQLKAGTQSADAFFFLALCALELNREKEALAAAEKALSSRQNDTQAALIVAEAKIKTGDVAGGLALAEKIKDEGFAADVSYLRGLAGDLDGRYNDAIDAYQKAIELDPKMLKAKFRIAYNTAMSGDDNGAIERYEEILKESPKHAGALMNLGILYEDKGRYDLSASCFQRVLKVRPTDKRARLYHKESVASLDTIVDDDLQKDVQKRIEILQIPISDFELSVRSRNCLSKMQIRTLGDLVSKTENELLGYKNFGETSLTEIRDILNSKGLRLGMFEEENMDEVTRRVLAITRKEEKEASGDILRHSVDELDFSLRSRRCLETAGVKTIGDLTSKNKEELLAVRNFGRTSLKEVRDKLAEHGLALRGEMGIDAAELEDVEDINEDEGEDVAVVEETKDEGEDKE